MRPARFLLVFFTFYFLLFTFTQPVQAQQSLTQVPPVQTNPYLNPNTNPDVPQNLSIWTQAVMIEVMSGLFCQLTGVNILGTDPQTGEAKKCLGYDLKTGKLGFIEGGNGAIGAVGSLIAATFTPPASSAQYIAYMSDKFGLVQPAYAQTTGVGFQGISPIVKIWEVFRNITYLFFVIAFVLIGFMIMLRVKIDPRTVMTVQNSIPRIIVSLILVTFSFAIAGLLIDVMYVVIYLFFNLLGNSGAASPDTISKITNTQQTIQGDNPFGVFNNLIGFREVVTNAGGSVKDIVQSIFSTSWSLDPNKGPSEDIPLLSGIINFFAGAFDGIRNLFGWVVGVIAAAFALLVVAIAILVSLFRLWFQLIMAYVWILIDIVFAPLWILGGILPGSPVGFSAWLRDMGAKLSAFPTTIFMFLLGKIFIDAFVASGQSGSAFVPPLVGAPTADALGALIALGIILLTPQVVTMVNDAFKAPKFPYGAAIGQAVGAGTGAPGGIVGQVSRFGSGAFGLAQLPKIGPLVQKMGFGKGVYPPTNP